MHSELSGVTFMILLNYHYLQLISFMGLVHPYGYVTLRNQKQYRDYLFSFDLKKNVIYVSKVGFILEKLFFTKSILLLIDFMSICGYTIINKSFYKRMKRKRCHRLSDTLRAIVLLHILCLILLAPFNAQNFVR